MNILHAAFECYPYAKVGGMADVVGALPKYQNELGANASVVMPRYGRDWSAHGDWEEVFYGSFYLDWEYINYKVFKGGKDFTVYTIDIPGKFDRYDLYSFGDDVQRSVVFQRAILHWLLYDALRPEVDVIHCHDHHTGLLPFMIGNCFEFTPIRHIPTVFTIHNGAYQGAFSWSLQSLLPQFAPEAGGLIEWSNAINPVAAAIKCAWKFTAVSNGYLNELYNSAQGLEALIRAEWHKAVGIINGIDADVWDPASDPLLPVHLKRSLDVFKRKNKADICETLGLNPELPLYVFIGRLAYEKGADMLPSIIGDFAANHGDIQAVLLGTGESHIENQLRHLEHFHPDRIKAIITYNEELAHRLYAGCDFLLMPSRVEPCGLNQMYVMRYGGIPIVRNVGGLHDTVEPLSEEGGNGFVFQHLNIYELRDVLNASRALYADKEMLSEVRKRNAAKDFSWQNSARKYLDTYSSLTK